MNNDSLPESANAGAAAPGFADFADYKKRQTSHQFLRIRVSELSDAYKRAEAWALSSVLLAELRWKHLFGVTRIGSFER
ncbi:MAG: hypothetical protein WB609_05615, partial [Candidatus Cybelea sp.]